MHRHTTHRHAYHYSYPSPLIPLKAINRSDHGLKKSYGCSEHFSSFKHLVKRLKPTFIFQFHLPFLVFYLSYDDYLFADGKLEIKSSIYIIRTHTRMVKRTNERLLEIAGVKSTKSMVSFSSKYDKGMVWAGCLGSHPLSAKDSITTANQPGGKESGVLRCT